MKNLILLFVFAAASFIQCKKGSVPPDNVVEPIDTVVVNPPTPSHQPIIEFGKSYMKKNGVFWNAPLNAYYYKDTDSLFSIGGGIYNSEGITQKTWVYKVPLKPGIYEMEHFLIPPDLKKGLPTVSFSITHQLDQIVAMYFQDTTRTDHFIEVIKYDSVAKRVEGRFQFFLKKQPNTNPLVGSVTEYLDITESKFNLEVKD